MKWRAAEAPSGAKFSRAGAIFCADEAAREIFSGTSVAVNVSVSGTDYVLKHAEKDLSDRFGSVAEGKAALHGQFIRYIIKKTDEFSRLVD